MLAMPPFRLVRAIAMLLVALTIIMAPAGAHNELQHQQKAQTAEANSPTAPNGMATKTGVEQANRMPGMAPKGLDRASMSTGARLLDWLGRLHPFLVHFPIAFLPAALFAAAVGRRRPGFAKPVRFLVIAGGVTALVAMVLGWFDGGLMLSDTDQLLRTHRWLGTGIGIFAFLLALWAWKRPESDRSNGMLAGLAVVAVALIVQGWFGGAMVHGADHMNW